MARFSVLLIVMATMLAGCGQVVVFGHVVRDGSISSEPKPQEEPGSATAPAADGTSTRGEDSPASASGSASASAVAPSAGPRPAAKSPSLIATHAIRAVNLTVTPEAASKVTGDASRFSADALLDAIKAELKSRKLLDEQGAQASGTAEVIVDDLATRPTTNAVVFGYKMLAGTLEGDVRVTGMAGGDSTGSRIVAQSKLTIAASGDDKNPLGPLYRRFAVLAADRLAGVTSQPQDPTGPPRF
jgi:hypothetical protein